MKFNKELVKIISEGRVGKWGNNSIIYTTASQDNRIYELLIVNDICEDFVKISKEGQMYITGYDYQYIRHGITVTKYIVTSIQKYK